MAEVAAKNVKKIEKLIINNVLLVRFLLRTKNFNNDNLVKLNLIILRLLLKSNIVYFDLSLSCRVWYRVFS